MNASALARALKYAARGEYALLASEYADDLAVFGGKTSRRDCFLRTVRDETCPQKPCTGRIMDRR